MGKRTVDRLFSRHQLPSRGQTQRDRGSRLRQRAALSCAVRRRVRSRARTRAPRNRALKRSSPCSLFAIPASSPRSTTAMLDLLATGSRRWLPAAAGNHARLPFRRLRRPHQWCKRCPTSLVHEHAVGRYGRQHPELARPTEELDVELLARGRQSRRRSNSPRTRPQCALRVEWRALLQDHGRAAADDAVLAQHVGRGRGAISGRVTGLRMHLAAHAVRTPGQRGVGGETRGLTHVARRRQGAPGHARALHVSEAIPANGVRRVHRTAQANQVLVCAAVRN